MIAVVIPCYQGARTVGSVVAGARAAGLDGMSVVVVDDGSTDDTARVAEQAGATVLRHATNQGKGAALATAFAWARSQGIEALVSMDADGQHDPAELAALIAAHREHPDALVIGVRSFAPEDMPRRSRIGNRISTWWISRFAGRTFRDTQSGFRVYPRTLVEKVASRGLRSHRFDTETELLLLSAKADLEIVEVPIRTIYAADHASHFRNFHDTLRVIRLVLGSPFWSLLAVAMLSVQPACAHRVPAVSAAAPVTEQAWRSMRAEHKVALEVTLPDGKIDRRSLRGAILVERPGRLRLRALGPGGIRLFDVLVSDGKVAVLDALEAPGAEHLRAIVDLLGRDLAAAYDLEPRPADRTTRVTADGTEVEIREPGRTIRLARWALTDGKAIPRRIVIDEAEPRYHVDVDVPELELDVALPAEAFLR